jgi:hypothetical protein
MPNFEQPIIIPKGKVFAQYRVLTPTEESELSPKSVSKPEPKLRGASFEQKQNELITVEKETIIKYFGEELGHTIEVPPLPAEITSEQLEFWEQNQLTLHYSPGIAISKDNTFPGQKKPLDADIYKWIVEAKISPEAAKLPKGWILIDTRAKPNYASGDQMYENDLLAPVLEKLRLAGHISSFKHQASRFNISADELDKAEVKVALAEALKIQPEQLALPSATLYNYLGNAFYPEWGETNTWEWFQEEYSGGRRLAGGYSGRGGLSRVSYDESAYRRDYLGFRPLARFF